MLTRILAVIVTMPCVVVAAWAVPLESWDNKIPNAALRFKVLTEFNSEAVLDKETQLVWERAPSAELISWGAARSDCVGKRTGGRIGWRLPSVHELASLVDLTAVAPPFLPAGHPFSNIQCCGLLGNYWSATTIADSPTHAYLVQFQFGNSGGNAKTFGAHFWCVRGGQNHGSEY